jgi:hypothetical protein
LKDFEINLISFEFWFRFKPSLNCAAQRCATRAHVSAPCRSLTSLSRTPLLTPGPLSRSGPRVSHPHRVACACPLPCSRGNAGRPMLPTATPLPPSSLLPLLHAATAAGPLPFFPLCPTPPSRLKSRRSPHRPHFSSHFPHVHARAPVSSATFPLTPWSSSGAESPCLCHGILSHRRHCRLAVSSVSRPPRLQFPGASPSPSFTDAVGA